MFVLILSIASGVSLLSQATASSAAAGNARTSQAAETLATSPSGSSPLLDPQLTAAKALLAHGSRKDAEQAVRSYLALHAKSADAHYLLGLILFLKPDASASLAEYTEAAKYRVPSAFDLKVVAEDYVVLGDFASADKWFTKSVEWNPGDAQTWYYLGRTKYNENRFEEAVAAFNQCLKIDSKNTKAADNLGLSYAGLGRAQEAAAAYQNAIAWQAGSAEKNAQPFINLGILLLEQSRAREAVEYLLQAIAISPQDSKAHQQLGSAYLSINRISEAQAEVEKAIQLAPENAPLHYMLGQIYRKQHLNDKAKVEFERYTSLTGSPSSPASH